MASQVLPKDDDFAAGSPAYGGRLCLYLGCRAATVGPTGQSQRGFEIGELHSGYQTIDPQGVQSTPAAFTGNAETQGTELRTRGVVFRRPFQADVKVSQVSVLKIVAGIPDFTNVAPRGVLARVQAGSIAADNSVGVRLENVSAYMASFYPRGTGFGSTLSLDRLNAGVFTNLAKLDLDDPTSRLLNYLLPATISLDCRASGADVALIATFSGQGAGTTTLTFTDTSGSKLTAAGRAGFLAGRDRTNSTESVKVVDLVSSFTVEEIGVGVTLVDLFQRYQLGGFALSQVDQFGVQGRRLEGWGFWDNYSNSVVFAKRDTAADRVKWTGLGTDVNVLRGIWSTRAATDLRSQRRSMVCQISAQPSVGQFGVGVGLRGSQPIPTDANPQGSPGFPSATCYYCACLVAAGGTTTPTFLVYWISNGVSVGLAAFADAGSTHWPGYASDFTLDFEVYNRNDGTLNGPTQIKLRVKKGAGALTQVVLVAPDGGLPPGVTIDASGTVQDASVVRISSGSGEAPLVYNSLGATVFATLDTWKEEALTGTTLPDRDQASVAVQGEGTAATSIDGLIAPEFPHEIEHAYHTREIEMDSGHVQRVAVFQDALGAGIRRRRWRFARGGLPVSELTPILDFWRARKGSEEAFTYTPLEGGAAAKVHFVDGSLDYALEVYGAWRLAFELEELR